MYLKKQQQRSMAVHKTKQVKIGHYGKILLSNKAFK